ncbi:uncharacterized protein LOC105696635 isoform X3 [Orussus abietinus]|uniref:uncharacterized protein LOC105696635 isoform X3 n=1 Tax=Orussus abietinus TaxID=222816 RepID=UPI000C71634A|nr:uncharacterized protein LOC105696635 isoform X3 [Orussus abietinus]
MGVTPVRIAHLHGTPSTPGTDHRFDISPGKCRTVSTVFSGAISSQGEARTIKEGRLPKITKMAPKPKAFRGALVPIFCCLLSMLNCAQGIDYALLRRDILPANASSLSARAEFHVQQQLQEEDLNKEVESLQEATIYLLRYGQELRKTILKSFGHLAYETYENYGVGQLEEIFRIYQETFQRQYNIFSIIPGIRKDGDVQPSRICEYMHEYLKTYPEETITLCIGISNTPELFRYEDESKNYTNEVLSFLEEHYPEGFSLRSILKRLQDGDLLFTHQLVVELLNHIQYDSYNNEVLSAEKSLYQRVNWDRDWEKRNLTLIEAKEITQYRSISALLKDYLLNYTTEFPKNIRAGSRVLAKHLVRKLSSISPNIENFGTIFENETVGFKYLFDLVIPVDLVCQDISDAKDYLVHLIYSLNIHIKCLLIDRYRHSSPDQLLLNILEQIRSIPFAVDIVTALQVHAEFWHRSRMVENVNELLQLLDSYENLRGLEEFQDVIFIKDALKERLWDTKNVTVQLSCTRPRECLRRGLLIISRCPYISADVKVLINQFLIEVDNEKLCGRCSARECNCGLNIDTCPVCPDIIPETTVVRDETETTASLDVTTGEEPTPSIDIDGLRQSTTPTVICEGDNCLEPNLNISDCVEPFCKKPRCESSDCLCKGPDCPPLPLPSCVGPDCSCEGPDCSCEGPDCSPLPPLPCIGPDCSCEGPDCPPLPPLPCIGPDCSCEDSDCSPETPLPCMGPDCSCEGPDCPPSPPPCIGPDCTCEGDECSLPCIGPDCSCSEGDCSRPDPESCEGSDCSCEDGNCSPEIPPPIPEEPCVGIYCNLPLPNAPNCDLFGCNHTECNGSSCVDHPIPTSSEEDCIGDDCEDSSSSCSGSSCGRAIPDSPEDPDCSNSSCDNDNITPPKSSGSSECSSWDCDNCGSSGCDSSPDPDESNCSNSDCTPDDSEVL